MFHFSFHFYYFLIHLLFIQILIFEFKISALFIKFNYFFPKFLIYSLFLIFYYLLSYLILYFIFLKLNLLSNLHNFYRIISFNYFHKANEFIWLLDVRVLEVSMIVKKYLNMIYCLSYYQIQLIFYFFHLIKIHCFHCYIIKNVFFVFCFYEEFQ